jgi:phenylpropionate dioxygenase-like ring-hydroxylating dioxygenase large terminal subunit
MISKEDNEILTRIEPGSLMGDLMRCYWTPVMLASEVAEKDGAPVRVRVFGEDLVAFRDSDGKVGLLGEQCPHRAASLALGVNEQGGLRCLYHGWKYAVDGSCLDIPTEPEGSSLCKKVKAKSYPVREAGGMIWAYMGKPERQPAFPDFEWFNLPAGQCAAFKILGECNYAQLLEGAIDTAHAGVLHRRGPWGSKYPGQVWENNFRAKLDVEHTAYGFRYAGIRKLDESTSNARVTAVVFPNITLIPSEGGISKTRRLVNAFVPRDDESTWVFQFVFDRELPVDVAYRIEEGGLWVDGNFRKLSNRDNWYRQDRKGNKDGPMSGIRGILVQDHAVGETQGRILDRTKEFLGTSDLAVGIWRRSLLKAARALRDGGTPPPGTRGNIAFSKIRAEAAHLGPDESWKAKFPLPEELSLERESA